MIKGIVRLCVYVYCYCTCALGVSVAVNFGSLLHKIHAHALSPVTVPK
jgi:hypothetical protein